MDYENICKYIGQLFLESRHHSTSLELKVNQLIVENSKLKKQLSEHASNELPKERSDT